MFDIKLGPVDTTIQMQESESFNLAASSDKEGKYFIFKIKLKLTLFFFFAYYFSKARFKFTWEVKVDVGVMPNPEKLQLSLCRHSICFLYGLPLNTMKKISTKMKGTNTSDLMSMKTEKAYDHDSYFGDDYTMEDIKEIFDANGIDLGIET